MKEIKILVFKLRNEFYATDIMEVERILGYEEPTALPDSPSFLEGVINYENSVLPIINLVDKFKLKKEESLDKKIIVVKRENGKFGILVDSVSEVINILEDEIKNPNSLSTLISQKYIKGLIKKKESIIIMLDLEKVLTAQEEEIIFQG
ncbi:purine-binding chemotaxis protein CheW [Clostridium sp. Sa3CUN1]|uniref:Purine-binding chemotaxis protein CheW n=1 Tax=Clostridium gallinarum TaxID=2762246 RepID=A0ABR8Q7C7_9CLOT|nr:chemotaxis protein CheW [Clostridium gallinarum]MBD7916336.1 purine-binding chemotaxis protein CheW [Clostridium gallinarum]